MIGKVVREEHYGVQVWVSPILEALRKSECLCWNCSQLKPGKPDNCPKAQELFEFDIRNNITTPVTRCPYWDEK